MKRTTIFLVFTFFAATFFMSGCRRDLLDFDKLSTHMEIEPNYVIPLIMADITLGEILKANDTVEHFAENDGDELIRLVMSFDSLRTIYAKDYLEDFPVIDTSIRSATLGLVPNDGDFEDQFVESVIFTDLLSSYFTPAVKASYENYNGISHSGAIQSVVGKSQAKAFLVPFNNIRSAEFAQGNIVAEITNNYNVPVSFDLVLAQNKNGVWTDIGRYVYNSQIAKNGGTASRFIPARGIILDNVQAGGFGYYFENFSLFSIAGGAVDMSNILTIRFKLEGCKLSRGEVKLSPNQQFFGEDNFSFFEVTVLEQKRVYEMLVKQGVLKYEANSNFGRDIRVTLTVPDATKNDVPLETSFYATKNSQTKKETSLNGYTVNFTSNPDTPFNKIKIGLKYHLNEVDVNKFIVFDSANRVDLVFTNADSLRYDWVKGNMELDTINIEEGQVNFNMSEWLSNYFSGNITFSDPKFSLFVDNSCGVDGMANLSVKAQSANGTERYLFKNGPSQQFDILAPAFTEATSNIVSTMLFDKNNSRVVDLMKVVPNKLIYSGTVYTNYSNRNSVDKIQNHIHWDSKTNIGAEIIVPLQMSIRDLTIRKHFAASFRDELIGGDVEVDQLEELSLYFNVKNQFPLDIKIVYTLWDTIPENDRILDTLNISVLTAQKPDAVGKVGRHLVNIYTDSVNIKGPLLDNFLDANMIRADVILNTAQEGKEAKFYTHYNLQMGIMAGFKGKITKD